jgi:circadian clock protein KaiC
MALQFLLEGAGAGERNLYITLSETKAELLDGAASHGWTLGPNIEVFELQPAEKVLDPDQQQSLLYSSELELGETVKLIFETVERIKPDRIVRQSVGDTPPCPKLTSLSPPTPGSQALFCSVQRHRVDVR